MGEMSIALDANPISAPFGGRNSSWRVLIWYRSRPPNAVVYSGVAVYKHLTPTEWSSECSEVKS